MDQSGFDIDAADLPHRGSRSQALVRTIDAALPDALVRRARAAIAKLGSERLRQSYFTTFWLPRGSEAAHPIEEAVLVLWALARPRGCAGAEWWIGRAHTTSIPVGFHFDQDVKARMRRHPRLSSVFFFNSVRGGQLAVTDQRPGTANARRLQTVAPRRNRYAMFAGNLLHGVLDARGGTPGKPVPGPPGRMRITLVVNYWDRRPTAVPTWSESGIYKVLQRSRGAVRNDGSGAGRVGAVARSHSRRRPHARAISPRAGGGAAGASASGRPSPLRVRGGTRASSRRSRRGR
jgi:hypothetical protein